MKWDSQVVLFDIITCALHCSSCFQSFPQKNTISTDTNVWYELHRDWCIKVQAKASVFVFSDLTEQVLGSFMLKALGLTGRQWKLLRTCYNNSLIRQKQEVDKQYLLSGFLLEASTFVVGPSPKTGTLPCQSYFHFDAERHSSLVRGSLRAFCQNTLLISLNLFK